MQKALNRNRILLTTRLLALVVAATALLHSTANTHAATATFQQGVNGYTGTADTYGRADQVTTRFPNAVIVLVDNAGPIAHGLIRFDNIFGSGPGQVPGNATISSATLTLRTSNNGD